MVTWYRNDNNHYYHEPNDEEFMNYLTKIYSKNKKIGLKNNSTIKNNDFER
jgi:hypothetical protein